MLAVVLPPELTDKILTLKKEFAEAYQCKAALKPPVHITLYPPYKDCDDHESEVKKVLTKCLGSQEVFDLQIKGFDAFKNNGVIFLDILKSDQLKQLHKGVTTQMTKLLQPDIKDNQPYHPHITIAFRDIPKDIFPQAVKDYLPRKFEAKFTVDKVCFWRHSGRNWETIGVFPFRKAEISEIQTSLF